MSNSLQLSNLEAIRLVTVREIRERIKAKSYLVLTAILVVAVLAIGVISRLTGGGTDELKLGVIGGNTSQIEAAATQIAKTVDIDAKTTSLPDRAAATKALNDKDANAVLDADSGQVLFASDVNQQYLAILQQAWSAAKVQSSLQTAGLTAEQAAQALNVPPLTTEVINDENGTSGIAILTGTVAAVLLFISLQTFGGYVLMGVVEEKSTAVVEVLMARITSAQMLAGKVIGIGVPALIQFACAVAAGLISLKVANIKVPPEIWSTLPIALLWFLGGYLFYSTLFALAGSLVSRQEDAGSAAAPIQVVLIGAYLIVWTFGFKPGSTISAVLSMVPPFAPMVMPLRMASGDASVIEIIGSMALLALATFIAWRIAARIYERVLLQRGSRISWKTAFSFLRANPT